jgi:superfamily II DNA or RNA helicase
MSALLPARTPGRVAGDVRGSEPGRVGRELRRCFRVHPGEESDRYEVIRGRCHRRSRLRVKIQRLTAKRAQRRAGEDSRTGLAVGVIPAWSHSTPHEPWKAQAAKVTLTIGVMSTPELRLDHAHESPRGRLAAPSRATSSSRSPRCRIRPFFTRSIRKEHPTAMSVADVSVIRASVNGARSGPAALASAMTSAGWYSATSDRRRGISQSVPGSTRTLVLVPSLSLLAQTLREWAANAAQPFDYLAVCSDRTVVSEDDFVQHTAELGLPVTTDPDVIAAFLRRRGRRVVFATYQSSPQVAAAYQSRTPHLDLAIADEAHRCAGRASSEFATILDGGKIKSKRRLFMTATPRFYTPRLRREAGLLDVEVASMDDESVFGPVVHRLTFGEAIERDLLSDYQVLVVGVDDETYRVWAERGEFVTRDGEKITDARTLAGEIALAKAMRKYDLHRVISFHSRVKAARGFSRDVPDVIAWMPARARPLGAIWSEHVSGAMSSGHRDRVLLRFRNLAPGESGLLSNARCLGEGVDVPTLDGVAFIDPRRSATDIIQAVGRAIRKAPDKTLGTIILPVFIANNADPDQALSNSVFTHVWDVLKALRAHDDVLADELDELRRQLGARRGSLRRPQKIQLDLPTKITDEFARAFDVRLVEQTTASWDFWLGVLERYVEQEGHARVHQHYVADGRLRLGIWVSNQRADFGKGQLSADRAKQLASLHGWTWSPHGESWDEGFARLQHYAVIKGNARPPATLRDETGFRLGQWVAVQRANHNAGKLTRDRGDRLASLPGWTWDVLAADWEEGYERLSEYLAIHGDARPRSDHIDSTGFRLGPWVAQQRTAYRRGQVSADRVDRLEALSGWTWTKVAEQWEEGYRRLDSYARQKGLTRLDSRAALDPDGFRLGRWVSRQREFHRTGRLATDRASRLEALPGWTWDALDSRWEANYEHLIAFVHESGSARVPRRYVASDGYRLGQWVMIQPRSRKAGTLSAERITRLEALPGWEWDLPDESWEKAFRHLAAFVEHTGTARVRKDHIQDGFQLGVWVSRQQTRARRALLDPQQTARLEALPGWVWTARADP